MPIKKAHSRKVTSVRKVKGGSTRTTKTVRVKASTTKKRKR